MTRTIRYKIVEEEGKEYILVSQVPDYAREYFNSKFRIPSYRTIRYYVTKGVFHRPEKLGRETYFEVAYIMKAIAGLRKENK